MKRILFACFLLSCASYPVFGQTNSLNGKVIDASSGDPLPGVTVVIKGTQKGTQTDGQGNFNMSVATSDTVALVVSFVGYKTQEVTASRDKLIDIRLESSFTDMDEVVVIGYGKEKKSDLTGAIASINAAKLNTLPTANPVEALQGKIAGVDIGSVTSPGKTPAIRIRGNRSLNASNDPLYVVDGIPRNSISDIPVSDIESIEVLKDAASTAIYGSRGANGVILVTSKMAKADQPTQVSLNAYVGVNNPKEARMMNGNEYTQFRRDVYRANQDGGWNAGEPQNEKVFSPDELKTVNSGKFVDWQDLLFRDNSLTQEYDLNISQGSQKTRFLLSLGYHDEQGYYKVNDMKRYNVGLNLDHTISPIVKIGITSKLSYTNTNNFDAVGVNLEYMNPVSQPFDDQGNVLFNPSIQQSAAWNILANYYEPYINNDGLTRSFNVLYAEINVLKGLTLRSNVGIDLEQTERRDYYGSLTSVRYGRIDQAEKENNMFVGLTWDNIANYVRSFGKHNLNVTLVSSLQQQTTKSFSAYGEGMPGEKIEDWNLASATENLQISSDYQKWSLVSFLGRIQYNYADRFLFNFSLRADGSSVLAPGNKWGYFPAASGAWVISNEEFFQSNVVNNVKFRASYGVVGNSAISPYATIAGASQTTYNFSDQFYYGYELAGLVNKSLGWEYSQTFDLGLDVGILKDRISGSFDFYYTRTKDLLMQRNLPEFTGSSTIFQNIGSSSNMGVEAMVSSHNIVSNHFSWTTDFNIYSNKEKILSLITHEDIVGNNWFIGQPTGVFYDFQKLGIWQSDKADEAQKYNDSPGDMKLKDQNNDGSIDAQNDRVILGQKTPKFELGIRNSFEYKRFSFSVALEGKFGQLVSSDFLGGNVFLDGTRWGPAELAGNYWTPDNPSGLYPYVNRAIDSHMNLYGIRTGSYLNLQEVTLGYQFNQLEFFKNMNVYARVKNLFYVWRADTALDPQAPNLDISAYRTFVLGLNINF